ncbi:PREDICTED: uncharacterized protein LOC106820369, partial [Priapulus caudatus]|uniref:Uncharacterized protein LOC106820299 n=1 Tax=Priapulus caudatus TaxID=37621 RepID=A0ABM1F7F9_PRICU
WEVLASGVVAAEALLGASQQQLAAYTVAVEEVQAWCHDTERRVRIQLVPQATLQEKQQQMNMCKVTLHEVSSYRIVIDMALEKAAVALASRSDDSFLKLKETTVTRYSNIVQTAKGLAERSEEVVTEHQHFDDSVASCNLWLNDAFARLAVFSQEEGDAYVLQARLEKIQ